MTETPTPTMRRLDRARDGRPAAPIRIAHLGPGNFFRAHQAWYTEHAPDAADWGIAAFAGRRGAVARELAAQDGLYTLLVRAADGDRPEVVSAVSAVSAELDDWRRCFARPELALVTTTVTEAGYRRAADGGLDRDDPEVAADIAALTRARHRRRGGHRPRQARARARGAPRARPARAWPWCPATTSPTTARWSRAWSGSWPRPSTPASPPGSRSTWRS